MKKIINFLEVRSHKVQDKKLLEHVITLRAALAENRDYVAKETAEFLKFCLCDNCWHNDVGDDDLFLI